MLPGTVRAGWLRHLPRHLQRRFRPLADPSSGAVRGLGVPGDNHTLTSILRLSPDEQLRRQAWLAYHTQPAANAGLLDRLMLGRHEIASIMGHSSYAAYQLQDFTLARHPEAVQVFLHHLAADIHPRCEAEVEQLAQLKRRLQRQGVGSTASSRVEPWDRSYLMGIAKAEAAAADLSLLPQFFRLDRFVDGLSQLTSSLMGVSLVEQPLEPGGAQAGPVHGLMWWRGACGAAVEGRRGRTVGGVGDICLRQRASRGASMSACVRCCCWCGWL